MLDRFVKISDDLTRATESGDSNLEIDTSIMFLQSVKMYATILGEIENVTVSLKTRDIL